MNKETIKKKSSIGFDTKMFFIAIGLLILFFAIVIAIEITASDRRLIPISVIALIAGVVYESKRLTEKWKTLFYMVLGSIVFSFISFLPGKHESIYSFENHIEYWPYYFIFFFIIISIVLNENKIIPKLTEGITLIQSIAIVYWVIDFGFINSNSIFIKIALSIGLLFSLYTILNAFTYIVLTRTSRLILSLWSSIIMILFAADNIYKVYQNGQIETTTNLTMSLYLGLQYFLLGICSIYIVQNFFMITGFLPSKTTFFNAEYLRDVKALKNKHIERYSDLQIKRIQSFCCIVLAGTFFGINYYYKFLPRNIAIWIVFVILPYILFIYDYLTNIKKQTLTAN